MIRASFFLRRSLAGLQLADPDISEAHGIAVILKRKREFIRSRFVRRPTSVCGRAGELDVVLHEDAVVKDGVARFAQELAVGIEARAVEDDVIPLPFARRARSVDLRWILTVDRGGLAIGVGSVVVGIENLNFVEALQKDAAVAALLAFAVRRRGLAKLDVQLAIAKGFFRSHFARLRHDFDVTVLEFPFGGAAVVLLPLRKIFSVEEHDGV